MATETVRYTYRLRPGAQAERALLAEWNRCRWLWNEAVNQQKTGNKPTLCRLSKMLTEARSDNEWLRIGSQVAQQQSLRNYALALDHSFKVKGRGRPAVRKRKVALPTLEYTTRGFSISDNRLCLPKGVTIPVVWSRELPSEPRSVRVYRDTLGHWYASFVVTRDLEPAPEAHGGIGIDWGIKVPAVTTDPELDLPYRGHRKRSASELGRAQRKMSRRAHRHGRKLYGPQSDGYKRAARQAARIQKKAARQHQHDARMWARSVAQHDMIAIEDFKPTFLAKSSMARKAADIAIGLLKRMVIEYGVRDGRKVVLVNPAYTTMTCSRCFARAKRRLELGERTFRCGFCGYTADRDRNAARVILAVAESGHTDAEAVRRLRTRPPTLAESGNPPPSGVGKL